MVDWLEELLAQIADEDDEEQGDGPALEAERAAVPAPASGDRAGNQSPERAERPGDGAVPSLTGDREAQPSLRSGAEPAGGWRLPGSAPPEHALDALRPARAGIGRRAQAPGAAELRTEEAEKAGTEPAGAAEAGLEGLYRRTAQAGRPPVPDMAGGHAARTGPAEDPGRTAALTVDELDRAVKRDSRRYDGGMSIF